jgi:hypothetical protein
MVVLVGNVRDSLNQGGHEIGPSSHLGALPVERPLVVSATLFGLIRVDFFLQAFQLASLLNFIDQPGVREPKLAGFHPLRWLVNRLLLYDTGLSTKQVRGYTFFLTGVGIGPPVEVFDATFAEFRRLGREVTIDLGKRTWTFDLMIAPSQWLGRGVRAIVFGLLRVAGRVLPQRVRAWFAAIPERWADRGERHRVRHSTRMLGALTTEIGRQEKRRTEVTHELAVLRGLRNPALWSALWSLVRVPL